jgi:phage terminase large subunit
MSLSILDLFPPCADRTCPQHGRHKHLIDHQQVTFDATEKYVALIGGWGSSKTSTTTALGIMLSLTVPGNLGLVARLTHSRLEDSIQPVWLQMLERAGIDYEPSQFRNGFPRTLRFPNDARVLFREVKNIDRVLSMELGWFALEEALELQETVFTKLMGRLRLPAAARYLRGYVVSNPPDERHWIARWFGTHDGVKRIVDEETGDVTTFRMIQSRTRQNPHVPKGYVAGLKTLPSSEQARVLDGEFGFTADGPAVFPQFTRQHVGAPAINPMAPLVRGWDWGFLNPAATFHQLARCAKLETHWTILAEVNAPQSEAEAFADAVVKVTREQFGEHPPSMRLDVCDIAGIQRHGTGPGPVQRLSAPPYNLRFAYRKCAIEPGLDLIRMLLAKGPCACGVMRVLVSRACRNVIAAFQGGYHYPQKDRGADRKPVKNYYADFMDTVRYVGELIVRPQLLDPAAFQDLVRPQRPAGYDPAAAPSLGAWIERPVTAAMIQGEIEAMRARERTVNGGGR